MLRIGNVSLAGGSTLLEGVPMNGMGSPLVYYLGINDEKSKFQGIDMIKEDIRKLLENE